MGAEDSTPDGCCTRCVALVKNVRRYADAMGLRDWAVIVEHDPPLDPDHEATCTMPEDRRECELRFSPEFDLLPPSEQRYVLTHELVHPLLRDLYVVSEMAAREAYGGMAYRLHMQHVRRVKEQAVDAIAASLAQHMPSFEW